MKTVIFGSCGYIGSVLTQKMLACGYNIRGLDNFYRPARHYAYYFDPQTTNSDLYDDVYSPINIATDKDISIKELAELIARLIGYDGVVTWDGRSDGQKSKTLSTIRMKKYLGWQPNVGLEEGLKKTIEWYKNNNNNKVEAS